MPRVFAVSDLHTDFAENDDSVHQLGRTGEYARDTLICAGDVSDKIAVLRRTLAGLKKVFRHVFFVPGNHDLWVDRRADKTSLQKLEDVESLCAALGVLTRPTVRVI